MYHDVIYDTWTYTNQMVYHDVSMIHGFSWPPYTVQTLNAEDFRCFLTSEPPGAMQGKLWDLIPEPILQRRSFGAAHGRWRHNMGHGHKTRRIL